MKILITSAFIILLALFMFSCADSEENKVDNMSDDKVESTTKSFRQTSWGMTPDEVKSTETDKPFSENENVILYKQTYMDSPAQMGYVFKDGKLVKAAYLLTETYDNPDEYILTYEKIKNSLINEFGPPSLDEIKWLDDESSSKEASAQDVCDGKVVYRSEWLELDTLILLLLEGADNKCRQGIVFESKMNFLINNPKDQTQN